MMQHADGLVRLSKRIQRNAGRLATLLRRCDELIAFLDAEPRADIHALVLEVIRDHYPLLVEARTGHAEINKHELKVFSQNGEDGILLYLFSRIGTRDRRFIEFGVQDGRECNTANLSLNFGWSGLLLEGDPALARAAAGYYAHQLGDGAVGVKVREAFVTAENADDLLLQQGFSGEIDLLSIDVDGNDYWIWQAIGGVHPRVVVIEYSAILGPERCVSTLYSPMFNARAIHPTGYYAGASLRALAHLAQRKGYILAGCCAAGVNAFFVRRDVAEGIIDEVSVERAFYPLAEHWVQAIARASGVDATVDPYLFVKDLPWTPLT